MYIYLTVLGLCKDTFQCALAPDHTDRLRLKLPRSNAVAGFARQGETPEHSTNSENPTACASSFSILCPDLKPQPTLKQQSVGLTGVYLDHSSDSMQASEKPAVNTTPGAHLSEQEA